jgi:cytochrome c oxidase cbb3-type subunit 1
VSAVSQISTPASAQVDRSCRAALLVLFISSGVWLVIGSALAIISSLAFHAPALFGNCAALSYGRARPAGANAFLYGFCLQAGIGVALWLFAYIGRARMAHTAMIVVGAALLNLGVTVGVLGIFLGDSTGFETLELPPYAAALLFIGYLLIGAATAVTLHRRAAGTFSIAHWFLIAALFWFPWIYSTGSLLLGVSPVRGVTQAVIAWWYANNFQFVWLTLIGIGAAFYFVPRLANRPVHNSYLAALAFWMLILFGSWGGVPNNSPVPAWLPALSTVGTVLTVIPIIAIAMNMCGTACCGRSESILPQNKTPFRFIAFGLAAFVLAGLINAVTSLLQVSQWTDFTWLVTAKSQLQTYGFFAMVMFGAIYYLVPSFMSEKVFCPKLMRTHFWLAAIGIVLLVLPLAIGGLVQGMQLQNAATPFADIMQRSLLFLRVSTMGDVLILVGNLLFLINLIRGVGRHYRAEAVTVYTAATADLHTEGVRS